jgi:tRNA wybutosine-synthesizing protein 2
MDQVLAKWQTELSSSTIDDIDIFVKKLQKSYVRYGDDFLLLPSTAFDLPAYSLLDPEEVNSLYQAIATGLGVTHIATTRPIPLTSDGHGQQEWNMLRAPLNFQPLYGDFGPETCSDPPSAEDFEQAYWVTAKQSGIYQMWAPRWTMFSRGNVSEKARLLTLPSVISAVEEGRKEGSGSCAVDLYAGIGYFAFSYLKAGVDKVLCWDINPWSIEGLIRGARKNKWAARHFTDRDLEELDVLPIDARLLVFNEDNRNAVMRTEHHLPVGLPPIRHVNCGLLPTSKDSWETAVQLINEELGGWLHVHENFAVAEIEQKAEEVRSEIQRLNDRVACERHGGSADAKRVVTVECTNRLKSYAPGVMHCVIDIHILKYDPD